MNPDLPFISKMCLSHSKPAGISEMMWSVNLDSSSLGEYQTLGGNSGWPSKQVESLKAGTEVP